MKARAFPALLAAACAVTCVVMVTLMTAGVIEVNLDHLLWLAAFGLLGAVFGIAAVSLGRKGRRLLEISSLVVSGTLVLLFVAGLLLFFLNGGFKRGS